MKILIRFVGFVFAFLLFFLFLFAGNILLNFTGGLIFSLATFVLLIGVIIYTIRSMTKRKHKLSTNILTMVFAVMGIGAVYFSLAVIFGFNSQFKMLTDSPLSPALKVNIISNSLVGHAILNEEYESATKGDIEFYYPVKEENPQLLINRALKVIKEHESVFEDYLGNPEKMDIRVRFSHLLDNNARVESGYYTPEEVQISMQVPIETTGWEMWESTMVHEYSHYLFDMAVREKGLISANFPQWFDEGIATHIEGLNGEKIQIDEVKDKEWVPFNELAYVEVWNEKRRDNPYAPYFQAQTYLDRLIELKGPEVILKIIDKTVEYHSFEQAFLIVVGKTTEDFGNEVIHDIEQMINEEK